MISSNRERSSLLECLISDSSQARAILISLTPTANFCELFYSTKANLELIMFSLGDLCGMVILHSVVKYEAQFQVDWGAVSSDITESPELL